MTDVVDSSTRSRMMSGIRGKDTKPELQIRRALHHIGFRYRLHDSTLPGTPDLILKKYNAVVFVHGCFWHRHNCRLFKWPKTRHAFWRKKINHNFKNDEKAIDALMAAGWRVCVVWECAIKGSDRNLSGTIESITNWLNGEEPFLEISG